MLGQQPVQQEQAEGDEDDYLGDGDVRRVLAPHPGQWSHAGMIGRIFQFLDFIFPVRLLHLF